MGPTLTSELFLYLVLWALLFSSESSFYQESGALLYCEISLTHTIKAQRRTYLGPAIQNLIKLSANTTLIFFILKYMANTMIFLLKKCEQLLHCFEQLGPDVQ